MKWRRPELVSENGQFLLWKRTVFTLEKKIEVLKELDKELSQRLVGERSGCEFCSELRAYLRYGQSLVPGCPDKRGLSVNLFSVTSFRNFPKTPYLY